MLDGSTHPAFDITRLYITQKVSTAGEAARGPARPRGSGRSGTCDTPGTSQAHPACCPHLQAPMTSSGAGSFFRHFLIKREVCRVVKDRVCQHPDDEVCTDDPAFWTLWLSVWSSRVQPQHRASQPVPEALHGYIWLLQGTQRSNRDTARRSPSWRLWLLHPATTRTTHIQELPRN